jgi:Mn2+/Fe2+ NRAMP family transporter
VGRGDLWFERVDVVIGAVLTGVIGFFVVVACAATLHEQGISIETAKDAAVALEPLAGHLAGDLFAFGLIGAAVLAASILPLSTAYSVSEFAGREAALDDRPLQAPLFYATYALVAGVSAAIVLLPGVPLVPVLVLTQVLNAFLLVPLLGFVYVLARDEDVMGDLAVGPAAGLVYLAAIGLILVCVAGLAVLTVM